MALDELSEEIQIGSQEWKEHRRHFIGSSDAPVVMNCSPFKTPLELYQEKLGLKEFDHSNWATERGNKVEPLARAMYEEITGMKFTVLHVQSDEFPWMAASLDGYDLNKHVGLEIKCPKDEIFQACKSGVIHEDYIWQVEHQMIVTRAPEWHFVCVKVDDNKLRITDWAAVIYHGDRERQKRLIEKEMEFKFMLQDQNPPPLTDRDTLERTEPEVVQVYEAMKHLLTKTKIIKDQLKKYEDEASNLKEQMISMMKHSKEEACGVRIQKIARNSISEELIEKLGIDPEQVKEMKISFQVRLV